MGSLQTRRWLGISIVPIVLLTERAQVGTVRTVLDMV